MLPVRAMASNRWRRGNYFNRLYTTECGDMQEQTCRHAGTDTQAQTERFLFCLDTASAPRDDLRTFLSQFLACSTSADNPLD